MLSFGSRSCIGPPTTLPRSPSRNRRLVGYDGYDVIAAAKPDAPCVVDGCRKRVDRDDETRTVSDSVEVEETEVGQPGDVTSFCHYHQLQVECSTRPQNTRSFTIDSILNGRGGVPTSITDATGITITAVSEENRHSQLDSCTADQNPLVPEAVLPMDSSGRLKRFTGSSIESSNGSEQSVASECCSSPPVNLLLTPSAQHSTGCNRFPSVPDQLLLHYHPAQYNSVNKYPHVTTNDQNLTDVNTSTVQSFLPPDASQSSWRYQFQQRQNSEDSAAVEESRPGHRGLLQHHRHRGKRIRTIFTADQLQRLEAQFERQQYMVGSERYYLASSLRLTEAQVKVWFQNRRIKWRKQSVERQQAKMAVVSYNKLVNDDDFNDGADDSDSDFNDVITANTDDISGPECEYLTNNSQRAQPTEF